MPFTASQKPRTAIGPRPGGCGTLPYGIRQKFNRCSTLNGKNNIFVSGYSYYWLAWDIEKIQLHLAITEKIYIFVSVESTTVWN